VAHRGLPDLAVRHGRAVHAGLVHRHHWRWRAAEGCWVAGCGWRVDVQRSCAVRGDGYRGTFTSTGARVFYGKKILTPPGLPLQQQPPLLRRLGARHLLSPRHSIVDHPPRPIPRHTLQRPVPPCRRRLRAHTRPVPGRC
jgi:hypothetical protein